MWHGKQVDRYKFLKSYDSDLMQIIRYVFITVGILCLLVLPINIFYLNIDSITGISLIGLAGLIIVESFEVFKNFIKSRPWYGLGNNKTDSILNNFDFESLELLEPLLVKKNWQLFWKKIIDDNEVGFPFLRLGINYDALEEYVKNVQYSDEGTKAFVKKALSKATSSEHKIVNQYCVAKAFIEMPEFQSLFTSLKLTNNQIYPLFDYYQERSENLRLYNAFWLSDHRVRTGGIAKDWAISYTVLLDTVAGEIKPTIAQRNILNPIYNRSKLVDNIVVALSKREGQNILLVGPPGSGKKEIFIHLAEKVLSYQTKTTLDGHQIRILDIQRLLSIAPTIEQLHSALNSLFSEIIRAGNVILFIPEIGLLLNPDQKSGSVDVSNILESYLQDPHIRIVGTVTPEEYQTFIQPNAMLQSRFSSVTIDIPDPASLIKILLDNIPVFENRYNVFYLYKSLLSAIDLSSRYIKDDFSPQREIKLLEDIGASAHASDTSIITENEVTKSVERISKIPIQLQEGEKDKLANLEEELRKRVISQDQALKQVSDALLRERAGLTTGEKPIGTFLFLGPTGVGKTETAKALADIYFGSKDRFIRLDMSEYSDSNGVMKLLGSDPVNQPGTLTVELKNNPSSVILLDELEKADQKVRSLLLQVLDEGRLTTNFGRTLDFTNTIIIATSNAGSQFIVQKTEAEKSSSNFQKQLVDYLITNNIFPPELLNRFDGVIVYNPLTQNDMNVIVKMQIEKLSAHLEKEKNIKLEINENVIDRLAKEGYDPVFGARALQRVIKEKLETTIAKEIISQSPQPGSVLKIENI